MLCKECGSQIPDNATECEFCGAMVDASAADDTKVIDADELAAAEALAAEASEYSGGVDEEIFDENEKIRRSQMEKMMEDKKKQLSEIEKRRNEKRKRQRRKKFAIIALICAIAACAAGAGAYYLMEGADRNQPTELTLGSPSPSAMPTAVPSASPAVSPDTSFSPNPASASPAVIGQLTAPSGTSGAQPASSGGSAVSKASSGSSSSKTQSSSVSTPRTSSSSSGSSNASGASASSGSSSKNIPFSGIVSDKISAQLVTGGEVIYNTGTGRYLMTFTMGNTRYYANVSEGSTTEQIQGKTYTIDADATNESYNGNTVYEISSMTNYAGDYVLPNSGTKLLTSSDIKGLSKYDLALARNEIYARHGRKFQTPEYSAYFSGKSWYKLNPNYNYANDDSNLNNIERKNVLFILSAEKK